MSPPHIDERGERLAACIAWVESGIAATLEADPSGFVLGVESVAVAAALRDLAAEREAGLDDESG